MRYPLAIVLLTGLLAAPAADAAPRKKRPPKRADLVLTSVTTPQRSVLPYILRQGDRLMFAIRVTNIGPDPTKAGGTLRIFDKDTGVDFHVVRFRTPRIRPGRSYVAQVFLESRYIFSNDIWPTRACVASIRDRNTRNNCRKGPRFTSVPRIWRGNVNGRAPFNSTDGSTVETSVAEASFTFAGAETGVLMYRASGPVTYTISGGSGGCNYSGTGTLNIDTQFSSLQLARDLSSYYATGSETNETYTINVTCDVIGPQPPQQGPANRAWWASVKADWGRDKRSIANTYSDGVGRTWSWDLSPAG